MRTSKDQKEKRILNRPGLTCLLILEGEATKVNFRNLQNHKQNLIVQRQLSQENILNFISLRTKILGVKFT